MSDTPIYDELVSTRGIYPSLRDRVRLGPPVDLGNGIKACRRVPTSADVDAEVGRLLEERR